MEGNIPVPASAIRNAAIDAAKQIQYHRDANRKATARSLEQSVSAVLAATAGKDGEFASINASHVSTVLSDSRLWDSDEDAVLTYLRQYDVWS